MPDRTPGLGEADEPPIGGFGDAREPWVGTPGEAGEPSTSTASGDPSAPSTALRSVARVVTAHSSRYADRLAAELGRRGPADAFAGGYRLHFPHGRAFLSTEDGTLVMEANAPDEDALARVEDLLGDHLQRLAADGELVVEWRRM